MVVILPRLFWHLHEANRALHGFSDALIAKRYGPAYGFTSKEFRASTDFPSFVKIHDGLTLRIGDLKSIEITRSELNQRHDAWYCTAEADMNFSRGSLTFTFILKKENSSWKVYSYHEQ